MKVDRRLVWAITDPPPASLLTRGWSYFIHTHQLALCSVLFRNRSQTAQYFILKYFSMHHRKERLLSKLNCCRSSCGHFKKVFLILIQRPSCTSGTVYKHLFFFLLVLEQRGWLAVVTPLGAVGFVWFQELPQFCLKWEQWDQNAVLFTRVSRPFGAQRLWGSWAQLMRPFLQQSLSGGDHSRGSQRRNQE